jgi:DNA-binding CsgD family transcriptional regulator
LGLTERQAEILALVKVGATNAEISKSLNVSVNTVKTHLQHLCAKLGVNNRGKLARLAWELDSG